ncbi:transcriptional regulator with XRE-family HTH domain [Pedobacter africanus]|uniref:Transcriptional regulator with XRE-family HTH domain n=1 Tax=Pedobacter africanus TaxID=151894 RepID=A0ACC6KZN2_9SPHI|nr:helix-turn-helix transcriptional regulator [Pedobacter africanus]MDR6784583.1 transcriptional regulator with XRE-family HTH domain [Pedobacter africanus]
MEQFNYMKLTLGEKFALLRKQESKTLEEVAAHLKMKVDTYLKLEEDFTYPTDQQITKLGRLYGLRYDQVIAFGET